MWWKGIELETLLEVIFHQFFFRKLCFMPANKYPLVLIFVFPSLMASILDIYTNIKIPYIFHIPSWSHHPTSSICQLRLLRGRRNSNMHSISYSRSYPFMIHAIIMSVINHSFEKKIADRSMCASSSRGENWWRIFNRFSKVPHTHILYAALPPNANTISAARCTGGINRN